LKLYQNGEEIDQYTGDRSHDHLTEYIKDKSSVFARSFAQGVLKGSTGATSDASVSAVGGGANKGTNVFGDSVEVKEEKLEQLIKEGPVFVKFYAPWCGQ
jgi:thiol-disulfide isomerase/thioredoxin